MLDRAVQRLILNELAEIYPYRVETDALEARIGPEPYGYNLSYLIEHGLVDSQSIDYMDGGMDFHPPKITAKGLDFLQDDGGLSAILNTVTVRLHDDTIRRLLLDRVEKSDEPPSVKERLKEAIRSAPASALSQVAGEAVAAGVERLPDIAATLGKWLPL